MRFWSRKLGIIGLREASELRCHQAQRASGSGRTGGTGREPVAERPSRGMEHSAVTLVLLLALGACQALPQRDNDNFVFPRDDDTPVRSFGNRGTALETRLSVSGDRRPESTGVRLTQTTAAPSAACLWANQSVWYQPTGQCETLLFQGEESFLAPS